MNINEYKQIKKRKIREFLQGLKFENIGVKDKKIILGLTPECSDFFNKDEVCRYVTERFLNKINGYYINLIDTNIEYATSPEEIDLEIKKFVDKVRNEINNYKDSIIKVSFRQNKEEKIDIDNLPEVKEKHTLHTGLNFIKIKVGSKVYSAAKTAVEAEKEDLVVDTLSLIMIYIYLLKCNIEDKKQKYEEFIDFVSSNFSVTETENYLKARQLQSIFINEKDYETFLLKYKEAKKQLKSMVKFRNQNKEILESESKPKGK